MCTAGGGGGGTVYVQYQKEAPKKGPVKYDCVNSSSKEITLKYQYGKCVGRGVGGSVEKIDRTNKPRECRRCRPAKAINCAGLNLL